MLFSKMFSGNVFNLFATVSNLALQYPHVAVLNTNLMIITIQPKALLRGEWLLGPRRMTAVQPAMKSLEILSSRHAATASVKPVCWAAEEWNNSVSSSSDIFFMEWHSHYRKLHRITEKSSRNLWYPYRMSSRSLLKQQNTSVSSLETQTDRLGKI